MRDLLKRYGVAFYQALTLLTILSFPKRGTGSNNQEQPNSSSQQAQTNQASPAAQSIAPAFYPWVGLVLAGIMYLAVQALKSLLISQPLVIQEPLVGAALLGLFVLMLLAVLTRGLHMDGLMDCVDARFGGWDPQRRREILHDPHVGSFAVIAAVLLTLLAWVLLTVLLLKGQEAVLFGFLALSRLLPAVVGWNFSRMKGSKMGAAVASRAGFSQKVIALLGVLAGIIINVTLMYYTVGSPDYLSATGGCWLCSVTGTGFTAFLFPLVRAGILGMAVALLMVWCLSAAFEGVNGDVMGASVIVCELVALMAYVFSI